MNSDKDKLQIGELSKETGEQSTTIRYWTRCKLLTISGKTEGGFYLYDSSMVERVREIRRLQKEERLTVEEIRQRLMDT